MPINNDEEYMDCFCNQYKSRAKNLKFKTGHTYRNLKKKDYDAFNRDGFVVEKSPLNPENRSEFENDTELLLSKKLKGKGNRNNLNDDGVFHSTNKKKRWLLPNLLSEKADELYKMKQFEINDKKEPKNNKINHGLAVFILDKSDDHNIIDYFDSNDRLIKNKKINYKSFNSEIFNIRSFRAERRFRARRRKRLINLEKYFKKKRLNFKNGNRNRNSGIKRQNETFISDTNINQENIDEFLNLDLVKYFFSINQSHMNYTTPKSCRSGLKYYPGKFSHDYGVRTFHEYYHRRKTRILIKHTLKQKKYNQINDLIKYNLNDDNIDYFSKKDYIAHDTIKHSQRDVDKKLVIDLNSLNNRIKIITTKVKKLKSNLNESLIKPNIIQVSEDDHLFFKYIKTSIDETILENQQENTILIEPIKLDDIFFGKFNIKINDKLNFLNSIQDCKKLIEINICQESYPEKIIIKLDSLIKEKYELDIGAYLVFDLIENEDLFDYMYANIDFNEMISNKPQVFSNFLINECLSEISFENLYSLADEFVNYLVKYIDLNKNNTTKINSTWKNRKNFSQDVKYLIGDVSAVDQKALNQQFESYLNHNNKQHNQSFDENLITLLCKRDFKNQSKTCKICYDDLDSPYELIKLDKCGHEACMNCWQEYIKTKISNIKVTTSLNKNETLDNNVKKLTCLHDKCNFELSLNFLYTIISLKLVKKYIEFYTDLSIIKNHKKYVYCKNQRCDKILIVNENRKSLATICDCGYMLCNFCLMDMHFPAMCNQATEYFKYLQELKEIHQDDKIELYTSEGKNCPNCDNYMEKNMGCNHMACICGFNFCWLCLKEFYTYHNSNTGYACQFKQVQLKVYDSSSFLNGKSGKYKNSKLFKDIMNEQRKFRQNVNSRYTIKQGFRRISNRALEEIIKLFKSDSFDYNKDHLLKNFEINHLDEKNIKQVSTCINKLFSQIELNIYQLSNVIEYLALLLDKKNNINLKISQFSFHPILKNSLKKGVYLFRRINEIILSTTMSESGIKTIDKLINLNFGIENLINNLKHLILKNLNLYSDRSS